MIQFSKRSDCDFLENRLSQLLKKKQADRTPIIDLTVSNPTACNFDFYNPDLLAELENPGSLRYHPEAKGLLKARVAVAAYYAEKGVALSPDQIFLTASTSEAYSFLFRLLGNPGDRILAPVPGYPLFDHLARLDNLSLIRYPLQYRANEGFRINLEEFDKALRLAPKAWIGIHPNNPTGNFVAETEAALVRERARQNGFSLIVDEVFLDYTFNENDSAMKTMAGSQAEEPLTFTLSGLSKILGLPQMKLSWIVVNGPPALKEEAIRRLELIADTFLSVSAPVQEAWPVWFSKKNAIQAAIRSRIRQNLTYLSNLFQNKKTIELLKSEGGWYALLRLKHLGDHSDWTDDEEIMLYLLQEKSLLVHPGYLYDFCDESILVVSLLPPTGIFETAARILDETFL